MPSGKKGEKGNMRGDKPAAVTFGRDGVIVTDKRIGVYNEVGRYCEFGREAGSLYAL